jgi:perosamine synthetase
VPDVYLNPEPPEGRNGAWCTALIFGRSHKIYKDYVIDELAKIGFEGRPFFYPLSSMPAYGNLSATMQSKNPVAYDFSYRGICLPAAFKTTNSQLLEYCNAIRHIIGVNPKEIFD